MMSVEMVRDFQGVMGAVFPRYCMQPLDWMATSIQAKGFSFQADKEQEFLFYQHAFTLATGAGIVATTAAVISGIPAVAALTASLSLCSAAGAWIAHVGTEQKHNKKPVEIIVKKDRAARKRIKKLSFRNVALEKLLQERSCKKEEPLAALCEDVPVVSAHNEALTEQLQQTEFLNQELQQQVHCAQEKIRLLEQNLEAQKILPQDTREVDCILSKVKELEEQKNQLLALVETPPIKTKRKNKGKLLSHVKLFTQGVEGSVALVNELVQKVSQCQPINMDLNPLEHIRTELRKERDTLKRLTAKKHQLISEIHQIKIQLQAARALLLENINGCREELNEHYAHSAACGVKADPLHPDATGCT